MSNFVGLHTGLTGVRAAQVGLDTASNNVANANTEGYTRQRVQLAPGASYDSAIGPLGTGTQVAEITRMRDAFLDIRVRTTTARASELGTSAALLRRAEQVTGEPDTGVSGELTALWSALDDLAVDPASGAARVSVLSALGALTGRIRSVADAWDQLGDDAMTMRSQALLELNGTANEEGTLAALAETNRVIRLSGDRPVASDILDRRDLLLDRLAELTGATSTVGDDGAVTVSLGGATLLDVSGASTLAADASGGLEVTHPDGSTSTLPRTSVSGTLRGYNDFLTVDLPGLRAELGEFTSLLADELNAVHAAGYDPQGDPGGVLLSYDPADPAGSVAVAITDPTLLAAAGDVDAGTGRPAAHDGRNAEALAALRSAKVADASGEEEPLDGHLRSLVVELGAAVATRRRAAQSQADLELSARSARQGMHGVSLDEEMVSLVQFQRALEAATRVMTAIDEAMDTLINRTGLVGR